MDYKYYFIIFSGPLPGESGEEVTTMQIGTNQDLASLQSDAVAHWEGFDGEQIGEDPSDLGPKRRAVTDKNGTSAANQ